MATNLSCRQCKYSPLTYDLTPIFLVITFSNNFYSYFSITNITYPWIKTITRLESDFNSWSDNRSDCYTVTLSVLAVFKKYLQNS